VRRRAGPWGSDQLFLALLELHKELFQVLSIASQVSGAAHEWKKTIEFSRFESPLDFLEGTLGFIPIALKLFEQIAVLLPNRLGG